MPTPTGVVWDADPHTLAKHRLLQTYLATWLPTLLHGGYAGVTYAEGFAGPGIYRGGSAPSSEVLVTFGTSFFIRFCEVEGHRDEGDRVFGSRQWREVVNLASWEKKPFLVATYRESLRRAGFVFVLSFEMLDEQGHDLHLVFGTTHRAGLEKMKNAMWAIDPVGGVRFRDPQDPDQGVLDFAVDPDLGPLSRSLLAELSHGPRTLAELKDHALVETVYRPPHARTIVQRLLRQGTLQRIPPRGHLTDTTLIKLAEQVSASEVSQPATLF